MFTVSLALAVLGDEATFDSNCDLGKGFDVIRQECMPRAFVWDEVDCTDPDRDKDLYCIESSPAVATQHDHELTVSSTHSLETLLSSLTEVSGSGYGVKMSASVNYVSKNYESSHSVSFYKTSSGDSYDKHVKYTERLKLNNAAKLMLQKNATQFVELYGSHFVSKVIYSNYFIASVKVTQTKSESSASLGIIAQIQAKDFFNLDAKETFDHESTSSSESVRIETEMQYNGQAKIIESNTSDDIVTGITDGYKDWSKNLNEAAEAKTYDYAMPMRMVYASWTESEDVQEMIQQGYIVDTDILIQPSPSAVVLEYLREDTIHTNADRNSIGNLLTWSCVASSSALSQQLQDIDDKLGAHLDVINKIDDAKMSQLEGYVSSGSTEWFVGRSGKYIDEVNELMMTNGACQGGSEQFYSTTHKIYPHPVKESDNWTYKNKLRFVTGGQDALLQGFTFTVGRVMLTQAQLIGETVGYQAITTANQVNGGGVHKTSISVWPYYSGGSLAKEAKFSLVCEKQGMYVSGLHIQFSNSLCTCATPSKGGSGYNQRQCTDGYVDWCGSGVWCKHEEAVSKANIGQLCVGSGRRRAETENALKNTPTRTAYGRISSMTVHCSPLPIGTYGLPSTSSVSGPYTLSNSPGKKVPIDCPAGQAVSAIDWVGRARAYNWDTSSTTTAAAWTIADNIQIWCRKFSDFQMDGGSASLELQTPKYATE